MKRIFSYLFLLLLAASCGSGVQFDAQGTFEADEVVVSSEALGRILCFDAEEGMTLSKGTAVGAIDSVQLHLQREQLRSQIAAILSGRPDVKAQAASLREQIAKQKSERSRVEKMLSEGAAARKQLDDIEAQIRVLEGQLSAMLSTFDKNNAAISANAEAMQTQIALLDDRIEKCRIVSPVDGTVLVKYAEAGEYAAVGKPLMKIANLENMYLRAYFTSDQLGRLKLGDTVRVVADFGGDERYDYEGRISWISSESEFTPKTIQTRESRANLVYAVKIAVKNDGRLKIGLPGEVVL